MQVCLRWILQQDVSLVVKSYRKERMKENLDIFDWKLAGKELDLIHSLPQARHVPLPQLVSPAGPYKTFEELWDGEM